MLGNWAPLCRRIALLGCGLVLWCGRVDAQSSDTPDATDWPTVISKLRQDSYQRPDNGQLRQQLAIAYNNYGVSLGNQGQWASAIQQLQEAINLDATNGQFQRNLSNMYLNQAHDAFEHHQLQEAKASITQATTLNPKVADAYILLGEIEYSSEKLKEAKAAWQKALELDPNRTEVSDRLKQVTQELPVESKFERLTQAYFDLRYEEQLDRPVGFDIRDALLAARREVGSDFSYWPTHKIVTLIYSAASFKALRQETPDWVGGQFDGKIRVPLPNGQLDQAAVKAILFHEYTHALIHDLATGKCPTWLNEGLAVYEEKKQHATPLTQLNKAYQEGRLVPWSQLSDQFSTSLPVDQVALGYQESQSIVAYVVNRYGFWRIRRVLKALGNSQPWESALADEFHLKLARIEVNWREWLPEFLQPSH